MRPISASPRAARRPAMPPPTTRLFGVVSTTIGSSGSVRRVRLMPARTRRTAFSVAPDLVVGVRPGALLADVHLGVLERVHAGALRHVAEGERVQLGRARGDDERVEALLLGVLHDLLLGRVGAGEHRRPGDHDVVVALDLGDDLVHVDVVADVAAALADVHADLAAAHDVTFAFATSLTFARSRWAAACATAAPAWRIESGMSLAPAAEPATNTPGRLVRPGSRSSSASPT